MPIDLRNAKQLWRRNGKCPLCEHFSLMLYDKAVVLGGPILQDMMKISVSLVSGTRKELLIPPASDKENKIGPVIACGKCTYWQIYTIS